jgi:hypothetical protein
MLPRAELFRDVELARAGAKKIHIPLTRPARCNSDGVSLFIFDIALGSEATMLGLTVNAEKINPQLFSDADAGS